MSDSAEKMREFATLRNDERAVIDALVNLVLATHDALDDSEEKADGNHIIDGNNFDAVSSALDVLEALPDDQPGYIMGPAAKVQWALRRLLGPSDPIPSQPDEREAIARIIDPKAHEKFDAAYQAGDSYGRMHWIGPVMKSREAATAILAMQAERRDDTTLPGSDDMQKRFDWLAGKLADMGYIVVPAQPAQPAPIAGLEPVAWQYKHNYPFGGVVWNDRDFYNGNYAIESRPLYTRAQLDAHAAEQVRAEREACAEIARSFGEPYALKTETGAMMFRAVTDKIANAIRARGQV